MRRPGSLFRLGSVLAAAALVTSGVLVSAHHRPDSGRFELVEATIASIQEAIEDGVISPDELVQMYLDRIAAYDGKQTATHLNSYIAVNRDAAREAKKHGKGNGHGHGHRKGVLFGIPVILKDNIDTEDLPTTAGSLALAGSIP